MEQSGVSLSEHTGWLTIRLEGQVGMEAAQSLQQQLLETPPQNTAIDWEQAEHVHTCVLQVLLSFRHSLMQRGLSVAVIRDNPRVREYLHLSGLGQHFPVPATPEPSSNEETHG
jgi:anti-anti-sigma factor